MLQWLKIKNLALVEDAEIEFKKGFNVISGETGAGKSVIINAISLLLGKRTDKSLIRTGKNRCELSAGINLSLKTLHTLEDFFRKNEIEISGSEIVIRKVITPNSTRNFINDSPVSLNALSFLGSFLIDFLGPNQHLSLLKPPFQLRILDSYGKLDSLTEKCSKAYSNVKATEAELEKINNELPDSIEAEHLRKIIREIENLNISIEETEQLTEQFNLASNSKEIIELVYEAKNMLLDSESSAINITAHTNRIFDSLQKLDSKSGSEFSEKTSVISEEIRELSIDLENYLSKIEIDEQEYYLLEEKINNINSLKRQYGPSIEQVMETCAKAQEKIDILDNFEETKFRIEEKLNKLKSDYKTIAEELSNARKNISNKFSEATKENLIKLGFLKADISVDFQETSPSAEGIDKVEIMFCPNPGESVLPLRNIASSGEISRVMLAIKTVLSEADEIPILIFDEIDANIGGNVANQVGTELRKLGKKHHVLCISHLPQIASLADAHYRVDKHVINGRTLSKITCLSEKERISEISRMLGGNKGAEQHAAEMLKKA